MIVDVSGLMAGVDEVGRGPLAGPVVAAAVILDEKGTIRGLNDSKLLTAGGARAARPRDPPSAPSAAASPRRASRRSTALNILRAALLAMRRAVEGLAPAAEHRPRRRQPAARAGDAGAHRDRRRRPGARDLGRLDHRQGAPRPPAAPRCTRSIRSTASTATRATRRPSISPRCASTAPASTTGAASRRCASVMDRLF